MNQIFGGKNIRDEILRQLHLKRAIFQHFTHQETEAHHIAKEVGVAVQEGIKCLILRGKKSQKNVLVCLLGHQKLDMRAVSTLFGENCEFEKIDTIKERFGLEVGGIPPFGGLFGLDVYFDENIQNCKEVIFSCGLLNESVRMKLAELILLIHPRFAKLAKE